MLSEYLWLLCVYALYSSSWMPPCLLIYGTLISSFSFTYLFLVLKRTCRRLSTLFTWYAFNLCCFKFYVDTCNNSLWPLCELIVSILLKSELGDRLSVNVNCVKLFEKMLSWDRKETSWYIAFIAKLKKSVKILVKSFTPFKMIVIIIPNRMNNFIFFSLYWMKNISIRTRRACRA